MGRSTVERWLRKHPDFAAAYEEGWAAALLFYEEQLVALVTGKGNPKTNVRCLLFVLRSRFRQVYSEHSDAVLPAQPDPSQPDLSQIDITKINDPQELLQIARQLRCRHGRRQAVDRPKRRQTAHSSSSSSMFGWTGVSPPSSGCVP